MGKITKASFEYQPDIQNPVQIELLASGKIRFVTDIKGTVLSMNDLAHLHNLLKEINTINGNV